MKFALSLLVLSLGLIVSASPASAVQVAFENYTVGSPATYDTASPINLQSNTLAFGDFGQLGIATERLAITFNVAVDNPPLTGASLVVPIRINAPATDSTIYFQLRQGSNVYGGAQLNDEDFILDGQFHEYVIPFPVITHNGTWTVEITLGHAAVAFGNGTMSVDFATSLQPAGATLGKTYLNLNLTPPAGEPAMYIGGYPVPEPASAALALTGLALLVARRRPPCSQA